MTTRNTSRVNDWSESLKKYTQLLPKTFIVVTLLFMMNEFRMSCHWFPPMSLILCFDSFSSLTHISSVFTFSQSSLVSLEWTQNQRGNDKAVLDKTTWLFRPSAGRWSGVFGSDSCSARTARKQQTPNRRAAERFVH